MLLMIVAWPCAPCVGLAFWVGVDVVWCNVNRTNGRMNRKASKMSPKNTDWRCQVKRGMENGGMKKKEEREGGSLLWNEGKMEASGKALRPRQCGGTRG